MRNAVRRPVVLVPVLVVAVAAVGMGLYLFQPWRLFTNVTVDEAFPVSATSAAAAPAAPASAAPEPSPNTSVPLPEPRPSERQVLAKGEFISHEHATAGTARILQLKDGTRVLRIEGLDTSNGPDLKVWITDAPVIEGTDGWFVFDDGAYLDLGSLKGNRGNQNYAIPGDADLSEFTSVTIWCDRFSVSFGAAELTPVA